VRQRSESVAAVWLVSIGIGVLFLARGAFQNYIFPLFEHLGDFSYAGITLLVTGYGLAQSFCAPLAGWYTDRTSVRLALATSIFFGVCSFLVISTNPGYPISALCVLGAGLAFILAKISLNTILVLHSSAETLRRSVAKRATLLNLGSFFGNSVAVYSIDHAGYHAHAMVLALLYLPLAIGLAAPRVPVTAAPRKKSMWIDGMRVLCRNKGFVSDALRRFALILPYGCWGTIIPKYVYDQYNSKDAIWVVSLTSVCTTIIGAHFLAVYVAARLYRRGFKWEWWSMVSVLCYCTGLMLLMLAHHPVMLPVAIVVFICGEVLMTPCFDETAKKHAGDAGMGTCMGLLHLVDGLGRMLGATFSLVVYGWMRNSPHSGFYWPVVVSVFLCVCSVLHIVAFAIGRHAKPAAWQPVCIESPSQERQRIVLSEPQS
jgi:MFS family permease